MPPIHPVAVSAGVIAVSVAVAAAIAVYEIPEVRRAADDFRRRVAIALQSLGENIAPNERGEPLFNRPEDVDGFMMSSQSRNGGPDVVADEDSRRRQRDELMYWNSLRYMQQQQREQSSPSQAATTAAENLSVTSFDQMLRPDRSGQRGTYVVNTGADIGHGSSGEASEPLGAGGLLRRRREGARGLYAAFYNPAPYSFTDPCDDEYGMMIDHHYDLPATLAEGAFISPDNDEVVSDIYSASGIDSTNRTRLMPSVDAAVAPPRPPRVPPSSLVASQLSGPPAATAELFFDATEEVPKAQIAQDAASDASTARLELERSLAANDFMTASQGGSEDGDSFNSIQAWAHASSEATAPDFSRASRAMSSASSVVVSDVSSETFDAEIVTAGELTPTDSMSVVDATEHTEAAAASTAALDRYDEVMSESEDGDGVATPTSWTEVGSVVSESDAHGMRLA